MDTIFNLHDWIGANRTHGTEVKNCEENQHRLLQIRTDVSGGVASTNQIILVLTCRLVPSWPLTKRSTMLKIFKGAQEKKKIMLTPIRILKDHQRSEYVSTLGNEYEFFYVMVTRLL